ncbi:unnamed protein product, partial [Mesorhabditis belari]|uniref:Cytochrome P450 n=1 Tax=Mesorhabditis belari TaxID=2138241 RepID=A0AAF3JC94_9BILA
MLSVLLLLLGGIGFILLKNWVKVRKFWIMRTRAVQFLDEIPGPPTIPLLGSAHLFKWDNEEFTYQLDRWAREYMVKVQPTTGVMKFSRQIEGWGREIFNNTENPLRDHGVMKVWVGPVPMVFLASCDAAKPVLESNTLITKPSQYNIVKQWIGEGLLISTGKKWYARRKMITPTFHFNILQGFYEIFFAQANILADLVDKFADTDQTVDLLPYVKRCALDIICETAMGTRINSQTGKNVDYVQAVNRLSQLIWDHERFPWLWFQPIWYLTGMGFEFDRYVKLSSDFTRKVILQRRGVLEGKGLLGEMQSMSPEEIRKHKLSFLDLMIGMQTTHNLSDEDIRAEVDTFMFEGHDTTSSGIGWALWWLGQELDIQKKCHDEIDEFFGDSDRAIIAEDLKSLPYLEMCLKEALRLTPPVPLFGRTLDHDLKIAHYTIPEGCTVFMSPMAAARDPRHFKHPDMFYPEHFSQEQISQRDPYSFIPFSAGPRNCVGQKFALAEEKSLMATLLRRFKFITMNPEPSNRFLPELILKPSMGFVFNVQRRKQVKS